MTLGAACPVLRHRGLRWQRPAKSPRQPHDALARSGLPPWHTTTLPPLFRPAACDCARLPSVSAAAEPHLPSDKPLQPSEPLHCRPADRNPSRALNATASTPEKKSSRLSAHARCPSGRTTAIARIAAIHGRSMPIQRSSAHPTRFLAALWNVAVSLFPSGASARAGNYGLTSRIVACRSVARALWP